MFNRPSFYVFEYVNAVFSSIRNGKKRQKSASNGRKRKADECDVVCLHCQNKHTYYSNMISYRSNFKGENKFRAENILYPMSDSWRAYEFVLLTYFQDIYYLCVLRISHGIEYNYGLKF